MRSRAHQTGMLRLIEVLQEANDIMDDPDFDDRASEGHLHHMVKAMLGAEPLAYVANIVATAMDARSKLQVKPEKVIDTCLQLHDRLYGAPKAKVKKADGNTQFSLDFAWGATAGDEIEVERVADDGTTITTKHRIEG